MSNAPVAGTMGGAAMLPPLREEVLLHRAPDRHDGSPAWVLEDPGRNLFFQVGWLEAEMLACWHLAGAEAIAGDISARTTLSVTTETVERFGKFLAANSLVRDSGMVERLLREHRQRTQQPLGKFLLKNYLFFSKNLPKGCCVRCLCSRRRRSTMPLSR
ncbi:MAG: hypothetical protein QM579_00485, partial [Desulfovibrio sp.]